ncbi:MAG: amidophosphoribosyltransferase [Gammaproteobacteria bacterium]|nr:amidophosphoribosyltransferase [Gammaproteobacteria bacterium]NIM72948.1 amidophosphoribosyltransferase [Gammaproteobacteria bacterium]NIN38564.1 amidophosphoribosyltransferase [Gammaproteobacteria bacterium]NIO24700.1 amidophosphoribosyltransferase [Gammaproteobacteria bacterium]NIO65303.1 amidophosphoribosyltransferase [Gammaproteobacteria bacterium]
MCGIIGIVARDRVNQTLYDALTVLQHRGQDAAGIATCEGQHLHQRKDNGLVREVFRTKHMLSLRGSMGIGHIRYPTAGRASSTEAQPFYVNSPFGITLAHNGNLINARQLMREVFRDDRRHINTESDSEILLNVFAHELMKLGKLEIDENDVFDAVSGVHRRCVGGYAVIAMIIGHGVVAFRDPFGIRPVCFGYRDTEQGREYMIASESVALDALGFELIRDLEPGEAVYVDIDAQLHTRQCADNPVYSPCIFEYVYLARPDSIIDDVSVYKARLRMGERLADRILEAWPNHDIDVVIPIPDTSRTAALPLSYKLGVKYREGFIKNRYIGRTFIMPGQQERERSVRHKLNAIDLEFEGKNVLLVDDSIVRGTTSAQIIQMAREAGARKVYFASAAPPVRYQNVYGIDMPVVSELIAHNRTEEQVAAAIGADRLFYQTVDDLIDAVRKGNPRLRDFDTSCFTGDYVTGGVTTEYLERIALARNDAAKARRLAEGESA